MRHGKSPEEACLEALARVAHNYNNDKKKLSTFHIFFYALNKDGAHGAASLWRNHYEEKQHSVYAFHDGTAGAACRMQTVTSTKSMHMDNARG